MPPDSSSHFILSDTIIITVMDAIKTHTCVHTHTGLQQLHDNENINTLWDMNRRNVLFKKHRNNFLCIQHTYIKSSLNSLKLEINIHTGTTFILFISCISLHSILYKQKALIKLQ